MSDATRPAAAERPGMRSWTECGGCGAKWPAAELRELLGSRPAPAHQPDGLLVGLAPFDDAAVLDLGGGRSLVSTIDFFPPLVDDPHDFGAIAAANACSDVFAMGATVTMALSVAAFPEALPAEDVAAVLAGAEEVVAEAGGAIVGGHTIRNPEPVFGLAVQGLVPTGRHLTKGGARPGDRLVLSKPLGTGLVLAADDPGAVAAVTAGMRRLNRAASEALVAASDQVHGATDVTGFGLLGHAWEMAERGDATFALHGERLPAYPGAREAAAAGVRTGGDARNREYVGAAVEVGAGEAVAALAFDPQTSGGLLAAVAPDAAAALVAAGFVEVGEVVAPQGVAVRLLP